MNGEVIIALDFADKLAVEQFLKLFGQQSLSVKVGMELYYQEGPQILGFLKEHGHRIFLDLKLHDIPNTVEKAMNGLRKLGVDMTNVHASGGSEMMKAARHGFGDGTLIAVTQLTSTNQKIMNEEQRIPGSLNDSVLNYASLAQAAHLDGVVCSPLEAGLICDRLGAQFLRITPGVRTVSDNAGDQKRVSTPKQARANGASSIVVGRPITQARDPRLAYQKIVEEWENSL